MEHQLNRFNWIAPFYDRLAKLVFGNVLKESQLVFLNVIKPSDEVLIVGGGAGDLLVSLLKLHPRLNVCYLEASDRMIGLARNRIPATANVNFIHGTDANIPSSKFDVVITNFLLDLFEEEKLMDVLESISSHVKANGKWIVTDFENSPKRSHRFLLKMMYFFFRVTKSVDATRLPDWRKQLHLKKFKIVDERSFFDGFINSTLLERT